MPSWPRKANKQFYFAKIGNLRFQWYFWKVSVLFGDGMLNMHICLFALLFFCILKNAVQINLIWTIRYIIISMQENYVHCEESSLFLVFEDGTIKNYSWQGMIRLWFFNGFQDAVRFLHSHSFRLAVPPPFSPYHRWYDIWTVPVGGAGVKDISANQHVLVTERNLPNGT